MIKPKFDLSLNVMRWILGSMFVAIYISSVSDNLRMGGTCGTRELSIQLKNRKVLSAKYRITGSNPTLDYSHKIIISWISSEISIGNEFTLLEVWRQLNQNTELHPLNCIWHLFSSNMSKAHNLSLWLSAMPSEVHVHKRWRCYLNITLHISIT